MATIHEPMTTTAKPKTLASLMATLKQLLSYMRETLQKIQILDKSKKAEYKESIRREVSLLTPQRLHAEQLKTMVS